MAGIYILELKERRHACNTEGKHKERITSTAMKIPWENSVSVRMCFFLFLSPSGKNYYVFFFYFYFFSPFNKYTHIIYTYDLHLKLFNKITTLKKPQAFQEAHERRTPVLAEQKCCQLHGLAQRRRTKARHADEQHVANL